MTNEEIAVAFTKHQEEIGSLKHRMADCEQEQKTIHDLTAAVKTLATNMEHMLDEQKEQSKRILRLEQAPLDDYRHYKRLVVGCFITGIVGTIIGAILALIIK